MKNFYEILGLNSDASNEQIKQAYRKLAKESHPDRDNQQNEDFFKDVNEAKQVLLSEVKKSEYDLLLSDFVLSHNLFTADKQLNKTLPGKKLFQKNTFLVNKVFSFKTIVLCCCFITLSIFLINSSTNSVNTRNSLVKAVKKINADTILESNTQNFYVSDTNVELRVFPAKLKKLVKIPLLEVTSKSKANRKHIPLVIEKPSEARKSIYLNDNKMAEILNSIIAKQVELSIKTNGIQILKTKSSNCINAFEIAKYLRKKGYIIEGREIVNKDLQGIDIKIKANCIVLTLGILNL